MDALFYPLTYATSQVVNLVYGLFVAPDIVDFPLEEGGDIDQALAVPYLPGMDAIVVTEARLVLRSVPKPLDIEAYNVNDNGSKGVFISTAEPSRLKKVEISYTPPLDPNLHLMVRAASKNGGLSAGVPLFAVPDFPGPNDNLFARALSGMQVDDLGSDRYLLTLPSVLGAAWLIQVASGNEIKNLQELAIKPAINRVVIDALPRNLAVVLAPESEALMLWQNPGVLMPESGDQEISFTPLAQKHLSAALKTAASDAAALPLPLRFHSDSGAAVQIVTKSLVAEYQVTPITAATTLELRGDFTRLLLNAPAGLAPKKSALRLTIKLLGRELNGASPEPSVNLPSSGLRVGLEHWIAAASAVEPRANEAAGSVVEIVSVRIYLASIEASEVVLEICSDVAYAPGAPVVAPIVKQLQAGFNDWLEFELPTALKAVAGNAPIWLALRTNKGEVRWFFAATSLLAAPVFTPASIDTTNSSRVSIDRGATWGAPNPQLGITGELLVQIFHRVDDLQSAPVVRIQRGATILKNNLLSNPQQKSPREYTVDLALPTSVYNVLYNQSGPGRVDSEFLLFSRSAIDLVVETLTLSYDPFSA